MGPRSIDRGNCPAYAMVVCWIMRSLQWGRDLLIAEMRGNLRDHVMLTKLQWGRDLLIAETCRSASGGRRAVASMGPRSIDRGNASITRWPSRDGKSFNGAAIY